MTDITVKPTILTREFDAPMELVFQAWTNPEHLSKWQIPMQGCQFEFTKCDIKNGGQTLHKMTMPNGHQMWLLTDYELIQPYDLLIFTQYMSNEMGEIISAPMPNWPKEIKCTVQLSFANNKTQLQFIWQPINPTQAEADAFDASRAQHGNGWGSGLDQLVTYLENIQ